jgi:AraC-like DNA-binding protein
MYTSYNCKAFILPPLLSLKKTRMTDQVATGGSYMACAFDIYNNEKSTLREHRRPVNRNGHEGMIYELSSPDDICLGYYQVRSEEKGTVVIENHRPFLQLSYTVSGKKSYTVDNGKQVLASFEQQQYNYLYFTQQPIHLQWQPHEQLEIFELSISTELFQRFLPDSHPLVDLFTSSMAANKATVMSKYNLPLTPKCSMILYDMMNCPLEQRYKQLYVKAKTIELLAIQLEQYEQFLGISQPDTLQSLKKEDVARMHQVRDIILANLNSPCSLIDLAHQVGTNDAYLKKHFKLVFGTTVYGYLKNIKMEQAREMLLDGKNVSEVAWQMGYKHTAHFTRAFKKHFGYAPNKIRQS